MDKTRYFTAQTVIKVVNCRGLALKIQWNRISSEMNFGKWRPTFRIWTNAILLVSVQLAKLMSVFDF